MTVHDSMRTKTKKSNFPRSQPGNVGEKTRLTNCGGGSTVRSMTITIPDEWDEFVRAKLQAGGFESPAAVVVATIAAWQGQEVFRAMDRDQVEHLLLEAIDGRRIP